MWIKLEDKGGRTLINMDDCKEVDMSIGGETIFIEKIGWSHEISFEDEASCMAAFERIAIALEKAGNCVNIGQCKELCQSTQEYDDLEDSIMDACLRGSELMDMVMRGKL